MEKGGQTTLFVILGIVLIIIILFFFFVSSRIPSAEVKPEEIPDLESYIQKCSDYVVRNGQGIAMRTATEQINFEARLREYHALGNVENIVALREGAMLRVGQDYVILKGATGGRIYYPDAEPYECEPEARLDFLLNNH